MGNSVSAETEQLVEAIITNKPSRVKSILGNPNNKKKIQLNTSVVNKGYEGGSRGEYQTPLAHAMYSADWEIVEAIGSDPRLEIDLENIRRARKKEQWEESEKERLITFGGGDHTYLGGVPQGLQHHLKKVRLFVSRGHPIKPEHVIEVLRMVPEEGTVAQSEKQRDRQFTAEEALLAFFPNCNNASTILCHMDEMTNHGTVLHAFIRRGDTAVVKELLNPQWEVDVNKPCKWLAAHHGGEEPPLFNAVTSLYNYTKTMNEQGKEIDEKYYTKRFETIKILLACDRVNRNAIGITSNEIVEKEVDHGGWSETSYKELSETAKQYAQRHEMMDVVALFEEGDQEETPHAKWDVLKAEEKVVAGDDDDAEPLGGAAPARNNTKFNPAGNDY